MFFATAHVLPCLVAKSIRHCGISCCAVRHDLLQRIQTAANVLHQETRQQYSDTSLHNRRCGSALRTQTDVDQSVDQPGA